MHTGCCYGERILGERELLSIYCIALFRKKALSYLISPSVYNYNTLIPDENQEVDKNSYLIVDFVSLDKYNDTIFLWNYFLIL